jgi:hypothetical protein
VKAALREYNQLIETCSFDTKTIPVIVGGPVLFQPCWTILVKASDETALPRVEPERCRTPRNLFGFEQFYYHPKWLHLYRTRLVPEQNIEIFGVRSDENRMLVCDLSANCIEAVAVFPFNPAEAFGKYQTLGLESLLREALATAYPAVSMAVAA